MKRSSLVPVATLCAALAVVGCRDAKNGALPTDPLTSRAPVRAAVPGTCTTLANLTSLTKIVFGSGTPNVSSVLGKLDNLDKQLRLGHVAEAQDQAKNIVGFVQAKSVTGKLPGTRAQVQAFINGVLCYAGLLTDTYLIYPTDAPQVIVETSGQAGVSLQGNTVDTPTLITVQLLDPAGPSPLITKLDTYPGYVQITASSVLTKPAIVAVCPTGPIPTEVLARLRLGHQATSGFEITRAADASFLNCSGVAASRVPSWLRQLASLVLPQPLYAATMFAGGGVGGLASEFSPFAPVDDALSFSAGVGGLASEFNITRGSAPTAAGASSGARALVGVAPAAVSPSLAVACPAVETAPGTGLTAECRPVVTITTHNGTIMQDVPVGWAVQSGGGTIAPQSFTTSTCGIYDVTAATTTDATGKAGICWNLGPAAGSNTVVATPIAGGDAPAGVTFIPASTTFTAAGTLVTPTASATGESMPYDGNPHAGSGACSDGISPALSYSAGSAPVDAGSYTLTVTCAGSGYATVSATASIVIAQVTPVISVSCPASVGYTSLPLTPCTATVAAPSLSGSLAPTYTSNTTVGTGTATATRAAGGNYLAASGSATFLIKPASATATSGSGTVAYGASVPALPCVVSGLLGGDAGSVTCSTSVPATLLPGPNVTTPVVSPVAPANYVVTPANGVLAVQFVQDGCFSSPIGATAGTGHGVIKGTTVWASCVLRDATGATVRVAVGSLVVEDVGPSGTSPGDVIFSSADAFHLTSLGSYAAPIDTGPSAFISGHFYRVTATWNDGTSTSGYFHLQ